MKLEFKKNLLLAIFLIIFFIDFIAENLLISPRKCL